MTLTPEQETALIDLVRRVAKAEIMPRFRRLATNQIASKSAPDDLVTEADLASEREISAGARAILPEAFILGEEGVAADRGLLDHLGQAPLSVIIDPIDGTWNFAHGLATFGVILAVAERGETVFGLLYDPVMDDWVRATKGGGTWYERADGSKQQLTLGGPAKPVADTTGLVPLFLFEKQLRGRLAAATLDCRRVWSVRCSCHEYRLMAQGAVDFCLTGTLNPWDHAAGALAVAEAGGAVSLIDGGTWQMGPTEGVLISARSPEILDQIRPMLAAEF